MNSLLILPLLVILNSATSSSASRLCVGAKVSSLPFNESLSDLLAWTNCFALKQFTALTGEDGSIITAEPNESGQKER